MPYTGDNALLSFETLDDTTGVVIRDELGGASIVVHTDRTPVLQRASPDWFPLPVDIAVSFDTSRLEFDRLSTVSLRDANAEFLGSLTTERWPVDGAVDYLDVSGGMKAYVYIDGAPFEGYLRESEQKNRTAVIDFEEPTRVVLGARSKYEQPAATMTVPDDPEAMFEAFSYLGSSIKEFSVERSWPTLRGHPPTFERGDTLDIPDTLPKPDTGVTIAVPPTYANIYRVAPLVFYLGADLVPGDDPELRLDLGYVEPLGQGGELEDSVDELLARCLLLDSLVRTDGYYSLRRYEYDKIAPTLHFYPPELYDRSLEEILLEYLEVPFSDLRSFVPRWQSTAVVQPDPADAELIPHLLRSFSRIHVSEGPSPSQSTSSPVSPSRLTGYTAGNPPAGEALITRAGLEHAADERVTEPTDLSMCFVATDGSAAAMLEATDWDMYGMVGSGSTAETVDQPTRSRLRGLLARDIDFLYYGGDVSEAGFCCVDGVLRFDQISEVGVTTFAFAGLGDVRPTTPLVDAGAAAGVIVERAPPLKSLGRLAQYLTVGYPLVFASMIAELPDDRRFVGDADVTLTTRKNGNVPPLADVNSIDEDTHRVFVRGVLTEADALGSVVWFDADFHENAYQLSGVDFEFPTLLSTAEVADLVDDDCILRLNGSIHHSATLSEEKIRRSARQATQTSQHDAK